jgi:putative nucleotidyltransferase with HDIG domain
MSVAPKNPAGDGEARQLMIVDDEPELLQSLVALFERQYMVVFAESGDKALELLHQGYHPQVILSDNRMPGISGIEFLAQSTRFVPDAVRVIMTGFTDIRDILAAINHGHVYMYLTKPWQIADLMQAIRICFQYYQVNGYNRQLHVEMSQKNELLQKLNDELTKSNKKLEEVNHKVYLDLLGTATALGTLIGSQQRYYYTNHATQCARISRQLGEALGFKDDKLNLLEIAALLHDIGQIGLPQKIQSAKPDSLTGADRALYESHVTRGAELLQKIERFAKVADIVEQHHERADGSGFPRKLTSLQILKEAQIVGMADLYHDMVYRLDPDSYAKRGLDGPLELRPEELTIRHKAAGLYFQLMDKKFDHDVWEAFMSLATSNKCPDLRFT